VLDQCNLGDTALCQYVHRNTNTVQNPLGDLVQLDNYYLNLNNETYQGVDLELGYRKALTLFGGGPEAITMRLFATRYLTNEQQPPQLLNSSGTRTAGPKIDNMSTTPNAATIMLGYRNGSASVILMERYTSSFAINRLYEESKVRTPVVAGNTTVDDNTVGAVFTTDLTVGWQPEVLPGLRVYSTFTNLFDRKPEILPTVGGRTGFGPGLTGDIIGRRFVVGAEYKF
jgi:hypothetical protein